MDEHINGYSQSSGRSTTVGAMCDEFGGEVQTGPFGSQLHASDYSEKGVPLVMPQDMNDGRIVCDRIARVNEKHVKRLKRHMLRAGDIVFSRRGDVTRFAVVTEIEEGWLCGTGSMRIRLNCSDICVRYVRRYLQQESIGSWLKHQAKGITMLNLNTDILRALPFVYSPLPEQRRIAAILDKADALRAKRRAALAQLDTLTQAIFLDMFGDPVTNPKLWPKHTLGNVAREKPNNGIFRKNPEYIQNRNDGLPVVWVEELFRGDSIDTNGSRRVIPNGSDVEKYGLKTGDILFCRSSLKLDGIAFNNVYLGPDDDALFECHLIRISPDLTQVSPMFLNSLLRLPQMRAIAKSKSKTATMTTIDQQGICSIEIPLPPVKLQREYARRVTAVENLRTFHRSALAQLDALFASLQYRAFRGEL